MYSHPHHEEEDGKTEEKHTDFCEVQDLSSQKSPDHHEIHGEPTVHSDEPSGRQHKEPVFQIRLSRALHRKLLSKAQAEGVSPQDLARELLSEGLVLRAWEIIERKQAMRSPANHTNQFSQNGHNRQQTKGYRNHNSQNNHNHSRNRQNHYNGHSSGPGHNRRGNFNHILEDSANFMEYVRSQEKKNL
ncbi:MAG: hypothetical protein H6618_06585 [Deltaproteobacteria bacterium]|nr:hypothetical protein [Deltaproteobacteria bacterium]